jgi:hypothetical protein
MTPERKRRPGRGGADLSVGVGSSAEYGKAESGATSLSLAYSRDRDAAWRNQLDRGLARVARAARWTLSDNVASIVPAGPGYRIARLPAGWAFGMWYPDAPKAERFRPWHEPVARREMLEAGAAMVISERPRALYPDIDLRGAGQ